VWRYDSAVDAVALYLSVCHIPRTAKCRIMQTVLSRDSWSWWNSNGIAPNCSSGRWKLRFLTSHKVCSLGSLLQKICIYLPQPSTSTMVTVGVICIVINNVRWLKVCLWQWWLTLRSILIARTELNWTRSSQFSKCSQLAQFSRGNINGP